MTIYKFYIAVEAASSHSLLVREGEKRERSCTNNLVCRAMTTTRGWDFRIQRRGVGSFVFINTVRALRCLTR